ncbi:MAG TPA: cytochrome c [Gammaproteobacteria bacterium]|nr:cytochrome c [Gammaproteobacteria bacterium]
MTMTKHTMMTVVKTLVATLVVVLLALGAFIYSGVYYVGADRDDAAMMTTMVHQTMMRSVAARTDDVAVPKDFNDPAMAAMGAMHYKSMCVACHLAPGVDSSEMRMGLNPKPPKLAAIADNLDPRFIFWVIKHGVRMTAMPAWGKSHDDEAIWAMTAFIKNELPTMTPAEFDRIMPEEEGENAHEHRHGAHGHEHQEEVTP